MHSVTASVVGVGVAAAVMKNFEIGMQGFGGNIGAGCARVFQLHCHLATRVRIAKGRKSVFCGDFSHWPSLELHPRNFQRLSHMEIL